MQSNFKKLTNRQWKVIKHFLNWQRKRKIDLRHWKNDYKLKLCERRKYHQIAFRAQVKHE